MLRSKDLGSLICGVSRTLIIGFIWCYMYGSLPWQGISALEVESTCVYLGQCSGFGRTIATVLMLGSRQDVARSPSAILRNHVRKRRVLLLLVLGPLLWFCVFAGSNHLLLFLALRRCNTLQAGCIFAPGGCNCVSWCQRLHTAGCRCSLAGSSFATARNRVPQ